MLSLRGGKRKHGYGMIDVIGEIGSNWATGLDRKRTALKLIEKIADAGANTVKIQLFAPESLWRKSDPHYKKTLPLCLPPEWLPDLKKKADECGIEFLVTPFHPRDFEVLSAIGINRVKISSGDINYVPLLREASLFSMPVLLSTGFATMDEIKTAVGHLRSMHSYLPITLLHCVGGYPTPPKDANLSRILDLKELAIGLDIKNVGLSSHVNEWWIDLIAIAYKISCIEKHIALKGLYRGPEDGHSLSPFEFARFVRAVRDAESAMNKPRNAFCDADLIARKISRRDPSDWLRPVKT